MPMFRGSTDFTAPLFHALVHSATPRSTATLICPRIVAGSHKSVSTVFSAEFGVNDDKCEYLLGICAYFANAAVNRDFTCFCAECNPAVAVLHVHRWVCGVYLKRGAPSTALTCPSRRAHSGPAVTRVSTEGYSLPSVVRQPHG